MPPESPAKGVRKGTKSCIECRQRKIRCEWPSDGSTTCLNCLARNRTCELQVYMRSTSEAVKGTSRVRISHLERNVSGLWKAVRALEAKAGSAPSEVTYAPPSSHPDDGPHEQHLDEDYESDSTDISQSNPPTHLLQLFENGILGSFDDQPAATSGRSPGQHLSHGRHALKRLMPSRDDMVTITAHASSWINLYNTIFPMVKLAKTSEEMLVQYDELQGPHADPVGIATLLLSVAVTVQQEPDDTMLRGLKNIKNASSFIKDVSDTVERFIVYDDTVSTTVDGIQACLLFLRLQLGRARVRKAWLILRRIIALAELSGLPRASLAITSHQKSTETVLYGAQSMGSPSFVDRLRHKAEIWESICALDRITSMMWSLSLATINYPLPNRPLLDSQGQVIPQAFLYKLADIASRVLELDTIVSTGKPLSELFNAVISTDQELRSLASQPPKRWWKIDFSEVSVEMLLQYWYQYLTIRTHLRLALTYDDDQQQFAFNFVTCLNASQELVRRYVSLRYILPPGFFLNRLIDLEAFTGAVFLLLASYRTTHSSKNLAAAVDVGVTTDLLDQVVRIMESSADRASDRIGGDFARHIATSIRSLGSLLRQPQTSDSTKMVLNLPTVGKIHVSRKSYAGKAVPEQPNLTPSQLPHGSGEPMSNVQSNLAPTAMYSGSTDLELMDSLSYSMEIPDNYNFLTDDPFGAEQWLTWTGWNGTN